MPFEVTKQKKYFNNLSDNDKFFIKDDLLFDCIGLGCGNSRQEGRVQGFNSGKGFGYSLLTYFASCAIDFRRMPFCEDRIYRSYFPVNDKNIKILQSLDENRIKEISSELKSLYDHAQLLLSRAGLDEVKLCRQIKVSSDFSPSQYNLENQKGYAETMIMLRKCADTLGLSEIQLEMDTLNSFGDEGLYQSEVQINLSIPASDVLYFSSMIGNRPGKQQTMESGEWVIINRSPNGLINLPKESINFVESDWRFQSNLSQDKAEKFIKKYQPVVFKPLENQSHNYGAHFLSLSLFRKIINKIKERA